MASFCGCYYLVPNFFERRYLPIIDNSVHSTILSTTSKTILKQTFSNPSTTEDIKECTYTFPLYDGVSVVAFTCRIGKKVLHGLVKEKKKAKQIFDQAVAKGETAGLLTQSPDAADVFRTKLGNIPAGETVFVEITYVGELKHHETDGTRFTIPTKIAPRYGSSQNVSSTAHENTGFKITIDVELPEGSFIKGIQSPSHPISVSMGTLSTATNADPIMSKASATLSQESCILDKDFVLIVNSKDTGIPKALLETHPTIPNQRAIMATLVPKFTLPPQRPEIVFVADRSGSMRNNIPMLISAMKVFLKSMPSGVKFNICSFGSSYKFLWKKSRTYDAESVQEAMAEIDAFDARMGGTQTAQAVKAVIEERYPDLPLEVILLTDGDIWDQNAFFEYVNGQVTLSDGKIRLFPLGIGNGVSHSLIEGLARAGNGFAQAVQNGERLDNAVVRMLRGALSPHITDYTLEVKYDKKDDDFESIDRVTEGLKMLLSDDEKSVKSPISPEEKATISLFDDGYSQEKDLKDIKDTQFKLPEIPIPKLLQAPHKIPSLFAFSRTTVYLLLSPSTIQRNPTSVILRGTSTHGPLALEIPIEILPEPAETIHQLAAKKAVQDLEEGRGWLYDAKDQSGKLVKERYPSLFDDLIQKEAVRLGEKFQVAGKWCSFVAVVANDEEFTHRQKKLRTDEKVKIMDSSDEEEEFDMIETEEAYEDTKSTRPVYSPPQARMASYSRQAHSINQDAVRVAQYQQQIAQQQAAPGVFGGPQMSAQMNAQMIANFARTRQAKYKSSPQQSSAFSVAAQQASLFGGGGPTQSFGGGFGAAAPPPPPGASGGLFGSSVAQASRSASTNAFGSNTSTGAVFGSAPPQSSASSPFGQPKPGTGLFGSPRPQAITSSGILFGNAVPQSTGFDASDPYDPTIEDARRPQQPQAFASFSPPSQQARLPAEGLASPFMARKLVQDNEETFERRGGRSVSSSDSSNSPPVDKSQRGWRQREAERQAAGPGAFAMGSFPQAPPSSTFFRNTAQGRIVPPRQEVEDSKLQGLKNTSQNPSLSPSQEELRSKTAVQGMSVTSCAPRSSAAPSPSVMHARILKKRMVGDGGLDGSRFAQPDSESWSSKSTKDWTTTPLIDKVHAIIELQSFDGFWSSDPVIEKILGVDEGKVKEVGKNLGVDEKTWFTLVVLCWLEENAQEEEGTWGLVSEKGWGWEGVRAKGGVKGEWEEKARSFVKGLAV